MRTSERIKCEKLDAFNAISNVQNQSFMQFNKAKFNWDKLETNHVKMLLEFNVLVIIYM